MSLAARLRDYGQLQASTGITTPTTATITPRTTGNLTLPGGGALFPNPFVYSGVGLQNGPLFSHAQVVGNDVVLTYGNPQTVGNLDPLNSQQRHLQCKLDTPLRFSRFLGGRGFGYDYRVVAADPGSQAANGINSFTILDLMAPVFDDNAFVVVTPLSAWPAGLCIGFANIDGGEAVELVVGNVTGAPIDPPSMNFAVAIIGGVLGEQVLPATVASFGSKNRGPVLYRSTRRTVDFASVAASSTLEQVVADVPCAPGDCMLVNVAAGSSFAANLVLSHAACYTQGQASVVVGNMTAAPIDPASIELDFHIFSRPPGAAITP